MWNKDPEVRLQLTELAFVNACNDQKSRFLNVNDASIDPDVEFDYNERIVLGRGMLRYHCGKVSPKLDQFFRPIRVEIEFEVPITDDDGNQLWCKCDKCWKLWVKNCPEPYDVDGEWSREPDEVDNWNGDYYKNWKGLPVTYGGRIDCLMEDELGRWWIVDWKTAARLSGQEEGDSPDEYIMLDDQITSYCWALWKLGIPIAGFIHHEMKKAFPVEPEPNKVQRKGCWYSVNKNQSVSYELYLETISEGDPTGYAMGAYDEFLDWLKREGPRYYHRKQVERSEAELRNAGHNIYLEALDITDPNLRVYPSPGRFACSFCAFRQPCIGMNRDEDVEYMFLSNFDKRSPRYWETTSASTESKGGQ
jgi:hypothetical protein